jgi:hypothetical protein
MLVLFDWVSPHRAAKIPERIRRQLDLSRPVLVAPEEEKRRQDLLDTRGWFAASKPTGKPLEV